MANAHLRLLFEAADTSPDPYDGSIPATIDVDRRWKDGDGSGEINRVYKVAVSLAGGPTTLALDFGDGSLEDVFGVAISGDELKALMVQCVTGEITVMAGAATGLDCFTGAQEGVVLSAGQTFVLDLGASGLDISTNAHLELLDGGAAATGYIMVITAE